MTDYKEAYLFDLDGTLAYTDGKHDDFTKIGEPIPVMIHIIKEYIASGKLVKIFTARYARRFDNPEIIPAIEEWCTKHIGYKLEICNEKLPGVKELWDDRAISVQRNTGANVRFLKTLEFYHPLQGNFQKDSINVI